MKILSYLTFYCYLYDLLDYVGLHIYQTLFFYHVEHSKIKLKRVRILVGERHQYREINKCNIMRRRKEEEKRWKLNLSW